MCNSSIKYSAILLVYCDLYDCLQSSDFLKTEHVFTVVFEILHLSSLGNEKTLQLHWLQRLRCAYSCKECTRHFSITSKTA